MSFCGTHELNITFSLDFCGFVSFFMFPTNYSWFSFTRSFCVFDLYLMWSIDWLFDWYLMWLIVWLIPNVGRCHFSIRPEGVGNVTTDLRDTNDDFKKVSDVKVHT